MKKRLVVFAGAFLILGVACVFYISNTNKSNSILHKQRMGNFESEYETLDVRDMGPYTQGKDKNIEEIQESVVKTTDEKKSDNATIKSVDDETTKATNEEESNDNIEEKNENEQPPLSVAQIGGTISRDGVEATVSSIACNEFGVLSGSEKSIRVYFAITNNSNMTLTGAGFFKFNVNPSIYNDEINRGAFLHSSDRLAQYVYSGEVVDGFFEWPLTNEVEILEISYYYATPSAQEYVGKWIVQ